MLDLEGRPAPHELRRRRDDDDEDTAHDRRRLALRQLFRWRNVALTTAVGLVAGLCVGALSPGDAAVERPLSSLARSVAPAACDGAGPSSSPSSSARNLSRRLIVLRDEASVSGEKLRAARYCDETMR